MEKQQWEDGYLNSYFTAVEPEERFQRRTDHELYCAGHLIEAAVAYAQATGKKKLLEIAEKIYGADRPGIPAGAFRRL